MTVDLFKRLSLRAAVGIHSLVFGTEEWIDKSCEYPEFTKAFLRFTGLL